MRSPAPSVSPSPVSPPTFAHVDPLGLLRLATRDLHSLLQLNQDLVGRLSREMAVEDLREEWNGPVPTPRGEVVKIGGVERRSRGACKRPDGAQEQPDGAQEQPDGLAERHDGPGRKSGADEAAIAGGIGSRSGRCCSPAEVDERSVDREGISDGGVRRLAGAHE